MKYTGLQPKLDNIQIRLNQMLKARQQCLAFLLNDKSIVTGHTIVS